MNATAIRNLSLAQAAMTHALYFLELEANDRAASYCTYAADHLQEFATNLTTDAPGISPDISAILQVMHSLTQKIQTAPSISPEQPIRYRFA